MEVTFKLRMKGEKELALLDIGGEYLKQNSLGTEPLFEKLKAKLDWLEYNEGGREYTRMR